MSSNPKLSVVLNVAIVVQVVAICGLGYWQYREMRKDNKTLKDVLVNIKDRRVEEKEKGDGGSKRNEEEENTRDVTFSKEQLENFKAALDTMNTQPFEGYMAEKVEIYYNSPNKSAELEPTRATLALDYLEKAKKPWVFPLTEEQKKKYASKEGFAELFKPTCLTGVSADSGHLVSLCFNSQKKIDKILLCNDLSIFGEGIKFTESELENFKAALDTMNTQPFEGYMAEKVEIYYNSPNKSTELKPTRATLTLDYLEKAKKPWVFPLTEEQKKKYASKEGFAELFKPSCLTGVSANSGHLVSLCFNGKKKIERILLCNNLGIFNN